MIEKTLRNTINKSKKLIYIINFILAATIFAGIYFISPFFDNKQILIAAAFLSFVLSCIVANYFISRFLKNYIKPVENINNTLDNYNSFSGNYKSDFIEFNKINDFLSINRTDSKQTLETVSTTLQIDSLTGLPNRISFNSKLLKCTLDCNQLENDYALIIVNINDFKNINYSHGQSVGDLILKTVTKTLLDNINKSELIAKTGNDEFAVILKNVSREKIEKTCSLLSSKLNKSYKLKNDRINLRVRIGASIFIAERYTSDEYVSQALDASRSAQQSQEEYEIYHEDKTSYSARKIEIKKAISKFSSANNLGLYIRYQPKMNLSTGNIQSLEVLTRMDHPEIGRIRPDEFISIAEEYNFISKLTTYIIEKSIEQAGIWHKAGKSIQLAVNISAKDLTDVEFPKRIGLLLKKYDVPANLIELEVTENVVIDDSKSTKVVLNRLSKMGISLAIDDFGIGYSGFNNLRSLPFNTLKIDKSFIFGMLNNDEDEIIVSTTIQVAHKLGMKVVAEGIDNIEVAFALTERFCDAGQGYLYSRPVSAEIIENEFLRDYTPPASLLKS